MRVELRLCDASIAWGGRRRDEGVDTEHRERRSTFGELSTLPQNIMHNPFQLVECNESFLLKSIASSLGWAPICLDVDDLVGGLPKRLNRTDTWPA